MRLPEKNCSQKLMKRSAAAWSCSNAAKHRVPEDTPCVPLSGTARERHTNRLI